MILGPSIEPEKASVKSASTPYPPWKVNFIDNLWFFNNSRPNWSTIHDSLYVEYCILLFVFWSSTRRWLFWPRRVFLFSWWFTVLFGRFLCLLLLSSEPSGSRSRIYRLCWENSVTYTIIVRDPIDQTQTRGPTAPYRHRPRIQAQSKTPHHRQH
jgi:hypothetical protein